MSKFIKLKTVQGRTAIFNVDLIQAVIGDDDCETTTIYYEGHYFIVDCSFAKLQSLLMDEVKIIFKGEE